MTKYLFIDGQCLQNSLTRMSEIYAGGQTINVNYNMLTRDYQRIFYYDALPERRKGEDENAFKTRQEQQHQFFDHLSSLPGYHVYEGEVRSSPARRLEQKKIEVMIAVDMLTHSFRRNMQEAAILTGDLDFKPLIDALVLEGMFVTLWYPSKTNVKELKASADKSMLFSIRQVHVAIDEDPKPFRYPAGDIAQSRGEFAAVLARWTMGGREALLMKEDGGIYVVTLPIHQHGNILYYRFGDLNVLRTFVEDEHRLKIPDLG